MYGHLKQKYQRDHSTSDNTRIQLQNITHGTFKLQKKILVKSHQYYVIDHHMKYFIILAVEYYPKA